MTPRPSNIPFLCRVCGKPGEGYAGRQSHIACQIKRQRQYGAAYRRRLKREEEQAAAARREMMEEVAKMMAKPRLLRLRRDRNLTYISDREPGRIPIVTGQDRREIRKGEKEFSP